jgi:hypothetical protein
MGRSGRFAVLKGHGHPRPVDATEGGFFPNSGYFGGSQPLADETHGRGPKVAAAGSSDAVSVELPAAGRFYESPNDTSEWIRNAAALLRIGRNRLDNCLPIKHWAAAVRAISITGRCRSFYTAEDRFGLVQQLLAVLTQRAILPRQLVGRILHQFPAALVKILALLYQLVTRGDQVRRDLFSLAD